MGNELAGCDSYRHGCRRMRAILAETAHGDHHDMNRDEHQSDCGGDCYYDDCYVGCRDDGRHGGYHRTHWNRVLTCRCGGRTTDLSHAVICCYGCHARHLNLVEQRDGAVVVVEVESQLSPGWTGSFVFAADS